MKPVDDKYKEHIILYNQVYYDSHMKYFNMLVRIGLPTYEYDI